MQRFSFSHFVQCEEVDGLAIGLLIDRDTLQTDAEVTISVAYLDEDRNLHRRQRLYAVPMESVGELGATLRRALDEWADADSEDCD